MMNETKLPTPCNFCNGRGKRQGMLSIDTVRCMPCDGTGLLVEDAAPPVAEAIPAQAASIDTPEFQALMEKFYSTAYSFAGSTPHPGNLAAVIAHINAAMTAYGHQQREEVQRNLDQVTLAYKYERERAEKTEAALTNRQFTDDCGVTWPSELAHDYAVALARTEKSEAALTAKEPGPFRGNPALAMARTKAKGEFRTLKDAFPHMTTNQPRRARKVGGSYQAEGTIVSEFRTLAGVPRYVFEFDEPKGMLHIFGAQQIEFTEKG
jgi:hypothetical protein